MPTIGFIGLGVMGSSITRHLIQSGYDLVVYNRTRARAEPLIELGAKWANSPAELVLQADIVFTMVGFPSDVRSLYLDEKDGMINFAKPKTIFVDMTTSQPTLACELDEKFKQIDCSMLDAPVSGGDVGARNATLTVFVGGDPDVYQAILPIFEFFGQNIQRMGYAGSGQHAKLCNQIAIAPGMLGVCESIRYAQVSGIDVQQAIDMISSGAAGSWSLSNYGPRILKDDFAPGFFIKHFIKDMSIALDEAERMNLQLPGLSLAKSLYDELAQKGFNDDGIQALYCWYNQQHAL